MLTLAIAANVVVFSLVNGLFLRPFPFPEPDRLVYINETAPRWNLEVVGVNYPDFVQWREGAKLFDGLALYDGESFNLSDGAGAERIEGATVTYDFGDGPRRTADPRPHVHAGGRPSQRPTRRRHQRERLAGSLQSGPRRARPHAQAERR